MKLFNSEPVPSKFTGNADADKLMNDLDNYPHAFVLGCIMDRQIKAENAWMIPYKVSRLIGGFEISRLVSMSEQDVLTLFTTNQLHWMKNPMAHNFYSAVQRIHTDYNDNAANIWNNNPNSAAVVRRLMEFDGVGIKIASMAANILARELKVPMKDYINIDISPDTHIQRVFKRTGLWRKGGSLEEIIYSAREYNPTYPGVFDMSCWEIGRNWCKPNNNPDCEGCYLNSHCPRLI